METLNIVAVIKSKPEFRSEIEGILDVLVLESRKEAGNVSYKLCQDCNDNTTFVVMEEWKSQDAIDFHNETPHFKTFLAGIEGKVEDVRINVLKQIK